jgi:hypothetical protein
MQQSYTLCNTLIIAHWKAMIKQMFVAALSLSLPFSLAELKLSPFSLVRSPVSTWL